MEELVGTAKDGVLQGFLSGPPLVGVNAIDVRDIDDERQTNGERTKMDAWLLGTGTPILLKDRSGPSTLIKAGGATMIVDCGSGTVGQLVRLGVSLGDLTHIFLTHHHIDHNADLGFILIEPWLEFPVEHTAPVIIGPPGTAEFVRRTFALHDYDIRARVPHGFDPRLLDATVLEVEDGSTIRAEGWTGTAFRVDHDPVQEAFGYRFDTENQSLVISGDTTVSDNLIKYAMNADVLVHEALYRGHGIPEYHTLSTEVGGVADRANVKHLVLTHLIPGHLPDSLWVEDARRLYSGPVTVGRDLSQIVFAEQESP